MTDAMATAVPVPAALAACGASGSRSSRAGGGSASARPDAELRARGHRALAARLPRSCCAASTGLAETYMDGHWDVDDSVALIRIAARNMRGMDRGRDALASGAARRPAAGADGPAQRPRRAAGATSPPTTTWATSSSRCSSTPR